MSTTAIINKSSSITDKKNSVSDSDKTPNGSLKKSIRKGEAKKVTEKNTETTQPKAEASPISDKKPVINENSSTSETSLNSNTSDNKSSENALEAASPKSLVDVQLRFSKTHRWVLDGTKTYIEKNGKGSKEKIDIGSIDDHGPGTPSPLHFAAQYGLFNKIKELLLYGADTKIKDDKGRTAYDIASFYGKQSKKTTKAAMAILQTSRAFADLLLFKKDIKLEDYWKAMIEISEQSKLQWNYDYVTPLKPMLTDLDFTTEIKKELNEVVDFLKSVDLPSDHDNLLELCKDIWLMQHESPKEEYTLWDLKQSAKERKKCTLILKAYS